MRDIKHRGDFRIDSLATIIPEASQSEEVRINILLPVFNTAQIYGGISTALKVFSEMYKSDGFDARIIITGGARNNGGETYSELTYQFEEFNHNSERMGLVFLRENNRLDIRKNDYFIVTSWNTAYSFSDLFCWQCSHYSVKNRKFIYLIQDYEPCFYPWSSEYALAESTYKTNSSQMIALVNSRQLYDYLQNSGYTFSKIFFFEPSLNGKLKEILLKRNCSNGKRAKKIIIYGRPNSNRNAFELLRYSLACWAQQYEKASEWEIVSLGDDFGDIEISSNNTIHSMGKLSLEGYADEMFSAYIGISLMVSPHPSYVPLELSTFGVKTITNTYANKDLSGFNPNIISIDSCSPQVLVQALTKLCNEYYSNDLGNVYCDTPYVTGNNFDEVVNTAKASLLEDLEHKFMNT